MSAEREELELWVEEERRYADAKFATQRDARDEAMRSHGLDEDGFWYSQIFQYVRRAQILGLDTPAGRQAIAKCYMTLGGFLESMIRVYGPLPLPSVPSGEVHEWPRDTVTEP